MIYIWPRGRTAELASCDWAIVRLGGAIGLYSVHLKKEKEYKKRRMSFDGSMSCDTNGKGRIRINVDADLAHLVT